MAKNSNLNGMIHSMYGSEADMAKAMGWSKQKLNRITNRKQEPLLREVYEISKALRRPFGDVADIFLPHESPKVDPKKIRIC
jgi:transcriptional regulator with XRE-family HTH domain